MQGEGSGQNINNTARTSVDPKKVKVKPAKSSLETEKQRYRNFVKRNLETLTSEFGKIDVDGIMFGGMAFNVPFVASKDLSKICETINPGDKLLIKFPKHLEERALERFNVETAYTTERLKTRDKSPHPHIVMGHYSNKIVLKNESESNIRVPYFLQERINGKSLADKLRSGERFSLDLALRIDIQQNKAYHYCHDRNVALCDGGLENILLDKHQNIKMIDFGIACDIKSENLNFYTQPGKLAPGSIHFSPPENWLPEPIRGSNSDNWISGVVQYTIISRRLPFHKKNNNENLMDIVNLDKELEKFVHESAPHISPQYEACIMQRLEKDHTWRLTTEEIGIKLNWIKTGAVPLYHPQFNKQNMKFEFKVEDDFEGFENAIARVHDDRFKEIENMDQFISRSLDVLNTIHPPYSISTEESDGTYKVRVNYHLLYIAQLIETSDTLFEQTEKFANYLLNSRNIGRRSSSGLTSAHISKQKELFQSILEKDGRYWQRLGKKIDPGYEFIPNDKTALDPLTTDIDASEPDDEELKQTFSKEHLGDTVVAEDEGTSTSKFHQAVLQSQIEQSQRRERITPTTTTIEEKLPDFPVEPKKKPNAIRKALIGIGTLGAIGAGIFFGYVKPQQEMEKMKNALDQSFITLEDCLEEEKLNLNKAKQLMENINDNTEFKEFISENGDYSLKYSNIESEYNDRVRTKGLILSKLDSINDLLNEERPKIGEADEGLKEIEENKEYKAYVEKVNEVNDAYNKAEARFKEKLTEAIEKPLSNAEEAVKSQNTLSAKEFTESVENYITRLNPVDYSDLYNRLNNVKKSVIDLEHHDQAKGNLSELLKLISDKDFGAAKEKITSLDDYLTKYNNKEIKTQVENKREFVKKCVESIEKLPDLKKDYSNYIKNLEELKKEDVIALSNNNIEALVSKIDVTDSSFRALEAGAFKKEHGYEDLKSDLETIMKNIDSFKHTTADKKYDALKSSVTKLDEISAFIENNYFKADCSERIKNGSKLIEIITKLQQGETKVIKDNLNDANYDEFDKTFTNATKIKASYNQKLNLHNIFLDKTKLAVTEDGKYTSEQQEAAEFVLRALFAKGEYLKGIEYEQYLNDENKTRMKPYTNVMTIESSIRDTNNHVRITPYLVTEKQVEKLEQMINIYKAVEVIKFNDEIITLSGKIKENGKILSNAKKEMNTIYDKLNDANSELSDNEKEKLIKNYNSKEKEMIEYVNQLITKARGDLGDSKRVPPSLIKNARDAWFRVGQLYQQAGSNEEIMKNSYIQARTYNSQYIGLLPKAEQNNRFTQDRNEAQEFEKRVKTILEN